MHSMKKKNKRISQLQSILLCTCVLLSGVSLTACGTDSQTQAEKDYTIVDSIPLPSEGAVSLSDSTTVAETITAEISSVKETSQSQAAGSDLTQPSNPSTDGFDAQTILSGMSLEDKVAQMFWVRCPAPSSSVSDAAAIQSQYQFGGYILFGGDFQYETTDSITANISSYQSNSTIPMLIGVDEEGGTVCRVSYYSQFRAEKFWSPRSLFSYGGMALIESDALEKAELLSSLGINVNLAPVCDISTDPNDYMYDRSFGGTPKDTSDYIASVVKVSQDNGVGTVLKHFPGYGNNVNTHTGIAVDERSYETFTDSEFVPFEGGIEAGAGCILVSHNIVNCMDSTYPASLSPNVHKILRDTLGFTGVIMTDDLSMDAITKYTDGNEAAVQAVLAGNDLLCVDDYSTQFPAVVNAVNNKTINEDQINASVIRILNWKHSLGLL